eukprot:jgi/Mesen1/9453/ME000627S08838
MAALRLGVFLLLALSVGVSCREDRSLKTSFKSISFKGIPVPEGDAQKTYNAFDTVTISGKTIKTKYYAILKTGTTYPAFEAGKTWRAGTVLDVHGVPLTAADSSDSNPDNAKDYDRSSLFEKFGSIWSFTHNENALGNLMLLKLHQDPKTGKLSVANGKSVALGPVNGLDRPCSGSLTPWTTHLASEEDNPNANGWGSGSAVLPQQVLFHRLSSWKDLNPYWYGWVTEAKLLSKKGDVKVAKRYAMGRQNWELSLVLPDKRTAVGTDDQSSGGMFTMFVASRAGDLTKGKLYGAKLTQTSAEKGGKFNIQWIELNGGHAVHENLIRDAIHYPTYNESLIKFDDLFETEPVVFDNTTGNPLAPSAGFRLVRTLGTRLEALKLKDGMRAYASRMETQRMVGYVGGALEFTKVEGLTHDIHRNELYMASTSQRKAMLDGSSSDLGGPNEVRVPHNEPGAVYKFKLGYNAEIGSYYVPLSLEAEVEAFGYNETLGEVNNTPQDSIASPDNVSYMNKYRTLLISEDCDTQHLNNYMWAHDTVTKQKTRILAAPLEAEVTSGYYFPNIGKFSYITATIQHAPTYSLFGAWTFPKE